MYMVSPSGKVKQVIGKDLIAGCKANGWTACDPPKKEKKRRDWYVNETSFDRR